MRQNLEHPCIVKIYHRYIASHVKHVGAVHRKYAVDVMVAVQCGGKAALTLWFQQWIKKRPCGSQRSTVKVVYGSPSSPWTNPASWAGANVEKGFAALAARYHAGCGVYMGHIP